MVDVEEETVPTVSEPERFCNTLRTYSRGNHNDPLAWWIPRWEFNYQSQTITTVKGEIHRDKLREILHDEYLLIHQRLPSMSLSRNKIDTRDDCPRAPAHLEDSPFVQFTGYFDDVLDASPFYRSPDEMSAWSAVFDDSILEENESRPLSRRGSLLLPVSHHGLSDCNVSSNARALYHGREASFLRTEYNANNVGWNYVVVPTPAHLSQVGVDNGTPPPRRQYHAKDFACARCFPVPALVAQSFALAESPRDVQPTRATEEHMEPSDYSTFSFLYGPSYTVFSHAHSTYSQTG
ncbi:hypothetical protein B0H14DRAFT_2968180 [Mycena olivaceomarginata]|nr:hypothetical protein B0H14DRAFT_2968180 [Mycena olivaceomarginata]